MTITTPLLLLVGTIGFAAGALLSAQIATWSLRARENKLTADRKRLNALRHAADLAPPSLQ
ncbi:hypothetical protein [Amycolatopsis sp. NPDC059657]|uniref:hypothetical protein n=1 Tax=Amycolatopsis sp. NPDC059657 TaxID=3346899 RepID=UPI00366CE6E5